MNLGALLALLKLVQDAGITEKTPLLALQIDFFKLPIGYTGLGLPPPTRTPSGQILTEEQKRALR